jgi:hypothetical protein
MQRLCSTEVVVVGGGFADAACAKLLAEQARLG